MPLISGTPESLLPRSDSKNPATTCTGLTSNGRPCRRSLATPKNGNQGVLAMLPHVGHHHQTAAAYFCWQHKDQATNLVDESGQIVELKQRSSIDTLIEKLGVLDLEDKKKRSRKSAAKKEMMPPSWSGVNGPLMSVPENAFSETTRPPRPASRPTMNRKDQIHVSFFCCMSGFKEEVLPPARPRPTRPSPQNSSLPYQSSLQAMPNTLESHITFIPPTLSETTRTNLITEISKPLTTSDHEPGYIYMFWLTPKDVPKDAARVASSLLVPQGGSQTSRNGRRTSDVLRDYNSLEGTHGTGQPRTIMLKIGRATNVHRRMVQWSQQCGHHITLLRYYPHQSSSTTSSPYNSPQGSSKTTATKNSIAARELSPSPTQKSPLIPRVERLIHLELADKRVIRDCEGCGKEHREWFEVEATRDSIREVDAVVRKWITWAQRQRK